MKKKNIVVLTGAGISAESGIPTFRDANGLWEGHDVMEVASIEGWHKNPALVQEFYNLRRKAALVAQANAAHYALARLESAYQVSIVTQNVADLHSALQYSPGTLARLESAYQVSIVTQNVDLLHEQAGSSHIVHLHGRLDQAKSSIDDRLVYPIVGDEIKMGDLCEKGSQLRPNIVWFGEAVPAIEEAISLVSNAHILIIVGTSLQVYPAAGLKEFAPSHCQTFLIDKKIPSDRALRNIQCFEESATIAVPKLVEQLLY